MKRVTFSGPGRIDVDEVTMPDGRPGQIIVKVEAVAICTLEQRFYKGSRRDYPFLGGHEISGTLLRPHAGHGDTARIVAVSRFPRCGRCQFCRAGQDNLCGYLTASIRAGEPWGPGGLSEYLACQPEDIYTLPAGTDAVTGALLEPLACVMHSIGQSGCRRGDSIAVFGLGFMGALHVRAAQVMGMKVVGVLLRNLACAPDVLLCTPDVLLADRDDDLTQEVAAAICIRGGAEAVRQAITMTRPGGRIVLFESLAVDSCLQLDLSLIRARELALIGALSHTRSDFLSASDLLHKYPNLLTGLVSKTFSFADLTAALTSAVQGNAGRVVVRM
jgi:L-iditol 2-dehydrogenase